MADEYLPYHCFRDDEENTGYVDGSSEDHAWSFCYSPDPASDDAAPPIKKPAPRKTTESIAKQRKQLEKDLAAHKKTLEQTKKKIQSTKNKLEAIKKKEIQQKKILAQKKQKLAQKKKNLAQNKKSPQKGQNPLMIKKRIVEERIYL